MDSVLQRNVYDFPKLYFVLPLSVYGERDKRKRGWDKGEGTES